MQSFKERLFAVKYGDKSQVNHFKESVTYGANSKPIGFVKSEQHMDMIKNGRFPKNVIVSVTINNQTQAFIVNKGDRAFPKSKYGKIQEYLTDPNTRRPIPGLPPGFFINTKGKVYES